MFQGLYLKIKPFKPFATIPLGRVLSMPKNKK